MAFEGITKGEYSIEKSKKNKHGVTVYPMRVDPKVGISHTNILRCYETEGDRTNAEFIAYCFNLQQKIDISCYELIVDTLEEAKLQIEYLHQRFSETGTGNAVILQIESVLTKAKRQ